MSPVEVIARFCGAGLAGYLLGSLPSGVIVGRLFGNVDPRTHGSGKTGTTNILRTLGPGPAALVALLDLAKGAAAIACTAYLIFPSGLPASGFPQARGYAEALAGFAALVGHNRSVFIRFTGGRGVVTGAGALLMLSPLDALISVVAGLVPIAITRYVSLGSIVGTATSAVAGLVLLLTRQGVSVSQELFFTAATIFIIASHRDNIRRLLSGTERKLGQRAS